MHKKSIKNNPPQIQIHFIQKNLLQSQIQQQNKLHYQILRVLTAQKQSTIHQLFTMQQNQIYQFFMKYLLIPDTCFTMDQLYESNLLKLIRNNGKIYFGEVLNRQMAGRGICYCQQGKIYEGEFMGNKRQGTGCQIYQNGNLYIGQFVNNKKHGKGQFFWFNHNNEQRNNFIQYYEGQWWGGLPDGKGKHQKSNGDLYVGCFKNGLKHGMGQEEFSNGDHYKGLYVNGLPEGIGQYSWEDGSYYKGDFKQGLRNGYGYWKINSEQNCQRYQGHYLLDKKSGYGVYTWQNGWYYKGNFQNDQRQGYGELFSPEKCQYRGQWKKGQKLPQQPVNNMVKISRLHLIGNPQTKQKEIKIESITQTINKNPIKLNFQTEHQLLQRPGFLIRRSKQVNSDKYGSANKYDKNNLVQSQSTLTSRIGTQIMRPISKISLSSGKNLKISRLAG